MSYEIKLCYEHADRCERIAEQFANNNDEREAMLVIARRWRQLAQSYEYAERMKCLLTK